MIRPPRCTMVGESAALAQVRRQASLAARGATSVLIEGDTGTGKELVAEFIHAASGRAGRLVAVNVAAIPDALFESAMFGHKRGAFTGAVSDEPGQVRAADRGTLFLDEICSLGREGQAKLLRVLETGRVMVVGATSEVKVDLHVIAASNSDLEQLVKAGRFRADLFYRISEWRIHVPALRDRREDIALLAQHFLAEWNGSTECVAISVTALDLLATADWPGNVRQLRQTIRRAAIMAEGGDITRSIMRDAVANGSHSTGQRDRRATEVNELVSVLKAVDWDIAAAALRLAVTKKTVYARLQKYDVAIPERGRQRGSEKQH